MPLSPPDPPLRNERPWRFCALCGAEMTWSSRGKAHSRETGELGRVFVWSCPGWTAISSKHDRHDRAVHLK